MATDLTLYFMIYSNSVTDGCLLLSCISSAAACGANLTSIVVDFLHRSSRLLSCAVQRNRKWFDLNLKRFQWLLNK